MHTPIREPLDGLRLCGLLPALTADTPGALAACIAALDGHGFPFVEVEAVSQADDHALCDMLPPLSGLTVAVSAALAAQERLARGATWAVCPARTAADGTAGRGEYRLCQIASMHQSGAEAQAEASGASDATYHMASQATDIDGLTDAHTPGAFARNAASLPPCGTACRILDTAASGDAIASLLRDASVIAARLPVHITAQTARTVADGLHALWVGSLGFTLMHIGLNAAGAAEADDVAAQFASLLGMAQASGPQSSYAGTIVEVMKGGGRGAHGHIGIGTADLARALYYASRKGFAFDWASRKDDAAGNPILYYLARDIAGYAVHFLQR